jgi:hypothetical protein
MQHQNTDSCWGWCSPPTPTSQITEIGRVTHCSSALPTSYQVKQTILSGGPQWPTHLSSRSPTRSALSKHTQPTPAVPVKQLAYQKAVERGWGGHWPAIDALIGHESGWIVGNWNISGSGACGLGQALPCSKMGSAYGNRPARSSGPTTTSPLATVIRATPVRFGTASANADRHTKLQHGIKTRTTK